MSDWRSAHAQAMRYLKAAAMARILLGLFLSLCGLLCGLLVASITDSAAYGGAVAALGMVGGLLSTRRGTKILRLEPLMVEGTVEKKAVQTTRRGNRYLLVMEVTGAWVLTRHNTRTPTPERVGARTLSAIQRLFDGLQEGQRVALVCLPTGRAVLRLDEGTEATAG